MRQARACGMDEQLARHSNREALDDWVWTNKGSDVPRVALSVLQLGHDGVHAAGGT